MCPAGGGAMVRGECAADPITNAKRARYQARASLGFTPYQSDEDLQCCSSSAERSVIHASLR
jgi:hypothetical protein